VWIFPRGRDSCLGRRHFSLRKGGKMKPIPVAAPSTHWKAFAFKTAGGEKCVWLFPPESKYGYMIPLSAILHCARGGLYPHQPGVLICTTPVAWWSNLDRCFWWLLTGFAPGWVVGSFDTKLLLQMHEAAQTLLRETRHEYIRETTRASKSTHRLSR